MNLKSEKNFWVYRLYFRVVSFTMAAKTSQLSKLFSSVADPHHFDADPDPACHLDADPDPARHFDLDPSFQIKAQNLVEKVLK